jgi:ABC-type Na+ efflux pump permease subunit
MRLDKMLVLARREYLVRVKTKGFWIGLLVLPVIMATLFVVPALVMSKTRAELDLVVVESASSAATVKAGLRLTRYLI